MKTPTRSAADHVRLDPSVLYDTPRELAADASLSVKQRLEMLRRWEFDVREQLVASGEGMAGSRDGPSLHAVAEAIAALSPEAATRTPTPTQHGALLPGPGAPTPGEDRRESDAGAERAAVSLSYIPLQDDAPPPAGHTPRPRKPSLAFIALGVVVAALEVVAVVMGAPLWVILAGAVVLLVMLAGFRPRRGRV